MSSGNGSLALGLVVYRPTEALVERIIAADRMGVPIFVFDNSPEDGIIRQALLRLSHATYHTAGTNLGLGFGLSSVCATAFYRGYRTLLFFDQDTIFTEETLAFVNNFVAKNESSLGVTHSAVSFRSWGPEGKLGKAQFSLRDVRLTISSGSVFFLDNLRRINWHNTSYFVDCVDYEFCLRSAEHGLRVAQCYGAPGFDHQSEQADTEVTILGKKVYLRRYPRGRVWDTIVGSSRLMGASLLSLRLGYFGEFFRFLCSYSLRQMAARLLLR